MKRSYLYSGNICSSNDNALLTTATTDNNVTDNSAIINTKVLFGKRNKDSLKKEQIFDNANIEKILEKATQTYDKYCLGTNREEIIYKNRERLLVNKIVIAVAGITVMSNQWTQNKI